METPEADTEDIYSDDYAALGLKNSGTKGLEKKPCILTLLGKLLECSVQKNERFIESSRIEDSITIFHGVRAPAVSIQHYIDRIFKYSSCSPSCFVVAQIYIERFIRRTNLFLTSLNVHRLLITSVMVAAKFIDDSFFNNAYYARVGGVSTSEMNKLEAKFLFALDFRLFVSVRMFGKYCSVFKRVSSGDIERPINACGVEEGWTNRDDASHARTIAK